MSDTGAKPNAALIFSAVENPRIRRAILLTAAAAVIAGAAISVHRQPEVLSGLDWRPALLIVAVGVPVSLFLNAVEYILSGRLIGRGIPLLTALETTIVASAANLAPLPGGPLVRVAGLKAAGAGYWAGTMSTLLFAGIWIGVAFLFAGAWMSAAETGPVAMAFLITGAIALAAALAAAAKVGGGIGTPLLGVLQRLLLVTTDAVNIYLALLALGADATFAQACPLAVASVVGSMVSIVPAGLGVREAAAAALAPLVGLTAGLGFLAVALHRILGLMVLAPIALFLARRRRPRPSPGKPQ